jgi:CelD/BcsL family acetyltransferase involved in cellulose biosynthesis
MKYDVRAGEGIFGFRIGNDDSYARYSPGTALFYLSLSYLLDHTDATWFEAPTDKDNWTLRLLPERRTLSNVLIGTGGLLDRTLVSAVPAMGKMIALPGQARTRWSQLRTPTSAPTP